MAAGEIDDAAAAEEAPGPARPEMLMEIVKSPTDLYVQK